MQDSLKLGDIVTTKAGRSHSPVMVVKSVSPDNYCVCIWYNSTTQQFEEYKFPVETLMR
jgi:uncharacterized protein YodC (DUF2158 family)